MGIDEGAFWKMNITSLRPYLTAKNIQLEEQNYLAWLAGYYVHIGVSVALSNALRKRGAKAEKYIENPIRITPFTEEEKAAKKEENKRKAINFFNAMIAASKTNTE